MTTAAATRLTGRPVLPGRGGGPALVTRAPINFTAALTKIANVPLSRRAELRDAHHPLFGRNIAGRVLVFPSCIGSTHTGLVLLDLVSKGRGPAASKANVNAPYDQCLPSRRFMLTREVKLPPRISFMVWNAMSSGFPLGGARSAAKMTLCSAPGRSSSSAAPRA